MESESSTQLKLAGPVRPPNPVIRFRQLSSPRQALVRLCQAVNFGQICGLEVRDSDPIFNPPPGVLVEVKLDSDERPRPEINLTDFILPAEFRRLVEHLDELHTATIELIEVRAGLARRVVFEAAILHGLLESSLRGAGWQRG
jgi:hypothetical protein